MCSNVRNRGCLKSEREASDVRGAGAIPYIKRLKNNRPVAQLEEHRSPKPKVPGSSPGGPAYFIFMLEIKKYPDSIMGKKCQEVEKIDDEILKLIEEMKKKMIESEGVGLAANQVGIGKKIIIVQTEKDPEAFINPKILKKSRETEISEEGCLSLPGVRLDIKRAKEVLIEALDIDGKFLQIEAKNLPARIFQHEIDHIEGRLIIDRISFFEKLKIRKQLKEIQ